jgi:hypothetical protein
LVAYKYLVLGIENSMQKCRFEEMHGVILRP